MTSSAVGTSWHLERPATYPAFGGPALNPLAFSIEDFGAHEADDFALSRQTNILNVSMGSMGIRRVFSLHYPLIMSVAFLFGSGCDRPPNNTSCSSPEEIHSWVSLLAKELAPDRMTLLLRFLGDKYHHGTFQAPISAASEIGIALESDRFAEVSEFFRPICQQSFPDIDKWIDAEKDAEQRNRENITVRKLGSLPKGGLEFFPETMLSDGVCADLGHRKVVFTTVDGKQSVFFRPKYFAQLKSEGWSYVSDKNLSIQYLLFIGTLEHCGARIQAIETIDFGDKTHHVLVAVDGFSKVNIGQTLQTPSVVHYVVQTNANRQQSLKLVTSLRTLDDTLLFLRPRAQNHIGILRANNECAVEGDYSMSVVEQAGEYEGMGLTATYLSLASPLPEVKTRFAETVGVDYRTAYPIALSELSKQGWIRIAEAKPICSTVMGEQNCSNVEFGRGDQSLQTTFSGGLFESFELRIAEPVESEGLHTGMSYSSVVSTLVDKGWRLDDDGCNFLAPGVDCNNLGCSTNLLKETKHIVLPVSPTSPLEGTLTRKISSQDVD